MMDYACKEGEVLFFGFDDSLRLMLSALCGVSGEADVSVTPRLCVADGEDPHACDRCETTAAAHRAALLLAISSFSSAVRMSLQQVLYVV